VEACETSPVTTVAAPLCLACTRLVDDGVSRCAAFPDGIPDRIMFEAFDHRLPFPGDHGIRFELAPGDLAATLVADFDWMTATSD
jgi:hypothetical protein